MVLKDSSVGFSFIICVFFAIICNNNIALPELIAGNLEALQQVLQVKKHKQSDHFLK